MSFFIPIHQSKCITFLYDEKGVEVKLKLCLALDALNGSHSKKIFQATKSVNKNVKKLHTHGKTCTKPGSLWLWVLRVTPISFPRPN